MSKFNINEDLIVFGKASIGDRELLTIEDINGTLEIVDRDSLNPGGVRINLVSGTPDVTRKGVINFGEDDASILGTPQGTIEFDHNTNTFNLNINGITQVITNSIGVTITGDLTVNGTTTSVNQTNLEITDQFILVNDGEIGSGITGGSQTAGIEIERGSAFNTNWQFQESDSGWGPGGDAGFSIIARVSVMDTTDVGNSLQIQGIGALRVPVGTTAQQPANNTGLIRFNTNDVAFELNDGTGWDSLSFASGSGVFVSRTGDVMTGDLEMATGQILGDDGGTAGAPSYAFSTDLITGMYRPGVNSLSLVTDATDRIIIDAVGNISLISGTNGNVTLSGNTAMLLHRGTTLQRPVATNGMIRYNTDIEQFEGHENSVWKSFAVTASGGGFVDKSGDTMNGALLMDGTTIQPVNNNTGEVGVPGKVFASMHATTFFGTATAALYADLAERYAADMLLDVGTVVVFGGEVEITECVTHANTAVAGVISGKPGIMMNHEAGPNETHPYVALKGKVPCKVIGPVKKGDLMITSMIRGHGKSAGKKAEPYTAFARALEDRDVGLTEQGIIMVSII